MGNEWNHSRRRRMRRASGIRSTASSNQCPTKRLRVHVASLKPPHLGSGFTSRIRTSSFMSFRFFDFDSAVVASALDVPSFEV